MNRWLRLLLKAGLTIGALIALVLTVDPRSMLESLRGAYWPWIVGAVLLLPVNLALEWGVWRCLLRSVDHVFSDKDIVGALLCGHALGFWTPVRAGEYAGRSLYFSAGNRGMITLTVLAQRLADMVVGVNVGLLVLATAFWLGSIPMSTPWLLATAVGLGTAVFFTAILLHPNWAHRWATLLVPDQPWITQRTVVFERITLGQGVLVLLGTGARYLVFSGQFIFLAWALQPSASSLSLVLAVGLTYYVKYLLPSLTLLDLGIREGAAVYFFTLLGLGAAVGLNAALLLFSINVLVPAVLGIPLISRLSILGSEPSASSNLRSLVPTF